MVKWFKIIWIVPLALSFFSCSKEAKTVDPSTVTSGYVDTSPGTTTLSVSAIYPVTGSTNVSVNPKIYVVFSKAINTGTVTANTDITISSGSLSGTISWNSDNTIATLDFSGTMSYGTSYTVTVVSGGIDASDGTTLSSTSASTFTTVADSSTTLAPRVLAATRIPSGGATSVSKSLSSIDVTFSEEMSSGTVTAGGSFTVAGGSVTIGAVSTTDNRTFRLGVSGLAYGTTYTVTLTNAIQSTTGNSLVLDGNHTWTFTTETDPDLPATTLSIASVWVTDITNSTARINWTTTTAQTGINVGYGTTSAYGSSQAETTTTADTVHYVDITGLTSAGRYYFQIDYGTATSTGYFITSDSGIASGDLPLSDIASVNKTSLYALQNVSTSGAFDGSSFITWLEGTDVKGSFFTTTGTFSWGADGAVMDSNSRTSPKGHSDGMGGLIVTMEGGGETYAKYVYNNGGSLGFKGDGWGTASGSTGVQVTTSGGTGAAAAVVWGSQGDTDAYYNSFTVLIGSGTATVLGAGNFFYDFSVDFTTLGVVSGDKVVNTSTNTFMNVGSNPVYRHAVELAIADTLTSNNENYTIGSGTNTTSYTATNHVMHGGSNYTQAGNNTYTEHGFSPPTIGVEGWIIDSGDLIWDSVQLKGTVVASITNLSLASLFDSGTAGSDTANLLVSPDNDFSLAGVGTGDYAFVSGGTTTSDYTAISTVSNFYLQLGTDIFPTGSEGYIVYDLRLSDTSNFFGIPADFELDDSSVNFTASGVTSGDIVLNMSDNSVNGGVTTVVTVTANNLTLNHDIFNSTNESYVILNSASLASGTAGSVKTNYLIDSDKTTWSSGGSPVLVNYLVRRTSDGSYGKVATVYDTALILDTDLFTSGNENYEIYDDYCTTHYGAGDAITDFYQIVLNPGVGTTSGSTVNIYDAITGASGTADTVPTNPLLDNQLAVDYTATTPVVTSGDLVFNTATGVYTSVAAGTIYARALPLATGGLFSDTDTYKIVNLGSSAYTSVLEGGITSTGGTTLTTAGKSFLSTVEKGDILYNITTGLYAAIVSVDSNTTLTISRTFSASDSYVILKVTDAQANRERITDTGTNGSTGTTLTDASAGFVAAGVSVGDVVRDMSSGTQALVTAVAATTLTLDTSLDGGAYIILQPRVLFSYLNSGGVYSQLVRLRDGSKYGIEGNIYTGSGATNLWSVSDGTGNAYVVYEISGTVYAKKVNGVGAILYGGAGASSGVNIGTGNLMKVLADGSGSIYVLYENGTNVYLTRRTATLTSSWTVTVGTGLDADVTLDSTYRPMVAYAYLGNVYVRKYNVSGGDVYTAQQITTFTAPGYYVSNTDANKGNIRIVSDGTDGAVVSWYDMRTYSVLGYCLYAQALNAAGVKQWNADTAGSDYDGILIGIPNIYDADELSFESVNTNDGAGAWNPIFIWSDYRTSSSYNNLIYDTYSY